MPPHLLVATDGSPHALEAARLAARLAGPSGALTLLHVGAEIEVAALAGLDAISAGIGGVPSEYAEQRARELEQEATRILAATRAVLPPDLTVHTLAATGRASDVILDHLERPELEGVVVGTRGRGLIARALLGSVSDGVLRGATKAVALARRDTIRSVLAAVDGSEPAIRAAKIAGEIAHANGAPLTLIHVVEFPIDTYVEQRAGIEAAFRRQAEAVFDAVRPILKSPPAAEKLVFHEPAHAIVAEAERSGADLVVVGRRGQRPSPRFGLGSVSLRVAHAAETSVLVVP